MRSVWKNCVLLLSLLSSIATYAAEPLRDIPRAPWEPIFFESINGLTKQAGWKPLRESAIARESLEVRIWAGFGLTELEGLLLRLDGNKWAGQWVSQISQPRPRDITPKSGWAPFWKKLDALGITTLPDSSALPKDKATIGTRDGVAYVVEISSRGRYRTYQYSNPEYQRWPEAKAMAQIVELINTEVRSKYGPKETLNK